MKLIKTQGAMKYGSNPHGTSYIEVVPETYFESEMLDTEIGCHIQVYEVYTTHYRGVPFPDGKNPLFRKVQDYLKENPVITPDTYDVEDRTCGNGTCKFRDMTPFRVQKCIEKCRGDYVEFCPNRKIV